jgi:arabinose-5-phosphate isomerase
MNSKTLDSLVLKYKSNLDFFFNSIDVESISKFVEIILRTNGKIIFIGIGKTGVVLKKASQSFSSLGIPSYYVDAASLSHGDFGTISDEDLCVFASNSGNTFETVIALKHIKNFKNFTVAITNKSESPISKFSDFSIIYDFNEEICINNLAPTTSTTILLIILDLVAVCVSQENKFEKKDFLKFHPGGNLGKLLSRNIEELMYCDYKLTELTSSFGEVVSNLNYNGLGITFVIDNQIDNKVIGVITDGDLRRSLINGKMDVTAKDLMSKDYITALHSMNYIEANKILNKYKINALAVVNNNNSVIGIYKPNKLETNE